MVPGRDEVRGHVVGSPSGLAGPSTPAVEPLLGRVVPPTRGEAVHFPSFWDGIQQARKPVDSLSGDAKLGGRVRGEREGGRDHRLHNVNLTAGQIRVSIRASSSPGAPRNRCLAHRLKNTPYLVAIPNKW